MSFSVVFSLCLTQVGWTRHMGDLRTCDHCQRSAQRVKQQQKQKSLYFFMRKIRPTRIEGRKEDEETAAKQKSKKQIQRQPSEEKGYVLCVVQLSCKKKNIRNFGCKSADNSLTRTIKCRYNEYFLCLLSFHSILFRRSLQLSIVYA